jgi:hypothetical protein
MAWNEQLVLHDLTQGGINWPVQEGSSGETAIIAVARCKELDKLFSTQ